MQKQAPTFGRMLTMAVFALSCFGLLLFLWMSFGGPTPLKAKGYRFDVALPEATQLAVEADVRVAGVEVGKVRAKRRDAAGNRTIATIEIDPRYAPIPRDARVAQRSKTLLGETYLELTTGTAGGPLLNEGELLDSANVRESVELDEILDTLDPYTRQAFRTWQQSLATGIRGRGQDVNDALGNLPGFLEDGGDLLSVLDEQRAALGGLVRNTGVVFQALTRREGQLRALVENSDTVFTAIQRERESFAQTFQVFPTFLDESRATFRRLERFSTATRPLVRDLKPAFDDLAPTLDAVGDFGPDLRRLFHNLDPLIVVSRRSLPAMRDVLDGLRPLLGELGPFLGELNPILDWVAQHQNTLTDVFANLGVSTAARTSSSLPGVPGHYLRQFGPVGAETVSAHPTRLSSNRGNAYINPLSLVGADAAKNGIIASFDCANAGGDKAEGGVPPTPPCRTAKPYTFDGKSQRFPNVQRRPYAP